jgi:murein DD-endopeptidase MepM/ murein hydrolase activator NlpD
MAMLLVYTTKENQRLKYSIADLNNVSLEQKKVILQTAQEVEKYKTNEETFNQKINDFTEKYREIMEKYINGKSASRSGDASMRGFSTDIGELKSIVSNLNNYSLVNDTSLKVKTFDKELNLLLDSIPTIWPTTGRISDTFGIRLDPFTRRKTFHYGIDIAAGYGTNIKSSAAGKVVQTGYLSGYGRAVKIDHGRDLYTLYGHTSKLLVKKGQYVKKGEVIAKVGSSGRSTGPHLHFEILLQNSPIDPLLYLEKK